MAMLDEAMALACGPADDLDSVGKSVCSFFTACYFAADFDRAGSWADTLRRQGLIGRSAGPALFLSGHCDSVQATALCELGRWSDAEAMLVRAIEAFEAGMGMPSWHPAIALAELRIRQGRLADAEMLLLGKDGSLQALLPAAHLHLARGDLDLARATATRGLRAVGDDRLRAADLLAVLVDSELAAGDLAAANAACNDLVDRAEGLDVPGLQARVAALRARVLAAAGDIAPAIGTMEAALDRLPQAGVPLLRATLLIELVRLHDQAGNRAAATVEAGRAMAALSGLDVVLRPDDLALLERATSTPAARRATLTREDRCWVASFGDVRCRLQETKGLQYVAELVRNPGVERHALDLVDRVEGVGAGDLAVDRRSLGDAGELVDAKARTAYRHRIEALRAEVDDAFAAGAEDRAEKLQAELDELVTHLAQAFGLGGRSRRASSTVERARLNVTRAIRAATARVAETLPEAGPILDLRLRTGIYCAYEPEDTDEVRWSVQS
jgi:tetratricopeptide (TPR) repeat protein